MNKLDSVKQQISKFDYVRFSFTDIHGTNRGVVIPARHAGESLEDGIAIFEGTVLLGADHEVIVVPHKKDYQSGNMAAVPDLETLRPIPWAGKEKYKVAELICETRWKIDNSPQEACPRYVLKQQLKRLEEMGLQLMSSFEFEYFLFHADTMKPIFSGKDYMSQKVLSDHGLMMFDMDQMLLKSGVDVNKMHSEYAPGQFECTLKPQIGLKGQDMAANFKQGIVEIATQMGMKATFISKLSSGENGLGAHFNHSLISSQSKKNVLFDPEAPEGLSPVAYHWIAGILKHSGALTAFCSPTVNCYRRLFRPWAPGTIFWGIEKRESSLRVKNHGPSETYFENRIPSGKANPYLVAAATVAAGLDGIINKLECPKPGTLQDSEPLPKTLKEALEVLQADKEFVHAIGEEFVEWFVANRTCEIKYFENIKDEDKFEAERKRYM